MSPKCLIILVLSLSLASCAHEVSKHGTIAELEAQQIELKDVDVEGGLDKAMAGYQKFLEETPESQLTPEAIRRLADLKIEKEYGAVTSEAELGPERSASTDVPAPGIGTQPQSAATPDANTTTPSGAIGAVAAGKKESEKEPKKAGGKADKKQSDTAQEKLQLPKGESATELENANAEQAIKLYQKLLEKYPLYERNDQVLYQLSRAYEEVGQVEKAMKIMNRLVKQFPTSRYNDEVHFRRGEYYFTRKKWLDAEDAYGESLKYGVGSVYYERALYKKGWTFYKQELYEEALKEFFILLDYKVSIGYDFEQIKNDIEKKRIDDTFRVVSLSFSNLGGADWVQQFFATHGTRDYEDYIYKELAEFYFQKRRYSDAATTYNAFIDSNPFHKKSPHYSMRVIEIYKKGNFPKLVIEGKKQFSSTYGLNAEYWNYFDQAEYPEVLGFLKTNLIDLANHYHSLYQNKKFKKTKPENFAEASHWYREFLKSFPKDEQSPAINYQLADLYLENKDFKLAAIEYEKSAYDYPVNDKSHKAAYATVYSYREYLKQAPVSQLKNVKRDVVRTSLRLVDVFPKHEKATVVLGAAVDDLFDMRDFALSIKAGRRLIEEYPKAEPKIIRGAWLVVAHSSYELEIFNDAEQGYIEVLKLTAKDDKTRVELIDNLAASIYKQGEQARAREDYREAVRHFLRIAGVAPVSKIRATAEYDAAAVLLQIRDLQQAVDVLLAFRSNYPKHELQKDVTKKIAYAYKEMENYPLAAKEYERIAVEAGEQEDLVREAMLQAAELYEKADDADNSLRVYKQFVAKFPKPLEFALETYYKIAMIYKTQNDFSQYRSTLQHIINTDAKAGEERTDRTRYLAAQSSLVIIEPDYDYYVSIKLVKPFKKSLSRKQKSMKALVKKYTELVEYKVADVTAASTFYIAEIYFNFNRSLMESEKPEGLSEVELEEFTLMVEEQAFPFEEKAIQVHEKNMELLANGIYSNWIDRSIEKLARLLPARYNKPEESTDHIAKIDNYIYSSPRFTREDASTGILVNLDFFRYSSQKSQQSHHKNQVKGDTDNSKTVNQEQKDVVPNDSQPDVGQVSAVNSGNADTPVSEETVSAEEVKADDNSKESVNTKPVTDEVKESTEKEVTQSKEPVATEAENIAAQDEQVQTKDSTAVVQDDVASQSEVDNKAKIAAKEQEQIQGSSTEADNKSEAESVNSKGSAQTTNKEAPEENTTPAVGSTPETAVDSESSAAQAQQ
ncbi:tetratricopeptide repeat protein [Kaarinaea lacus]